MRQRSPGDDDKRLVKFDRVRIAHEDLLDRARLVGGAIFRVVGQVDGLHRHRHLFNRRDHGLFQRLVQRDSGQVLGPDRSHGGIQRFKTMFRNAKSFCMMICSTELFENDKKKQESQFTLNDPEEENLLHESFKEALKNATDSLFKDEQLTVQESLRYKNTLLNSPSGRHITSEMKGHSPLSGKSQCSNNSGLKGKSMLKGKIDNFTQKKSLNAFEAEEAEKRKIETVSPGTARQNRPSDLVSMKSGSTNCNNVQSLYKFSEKENMTNSQANNGCLVQQSMALEKIATIIDNQLRMKSETLDLSNLGLNDKSIEKIIKKFGSIKGIRTLKLGGNNLTEVSMKGILKEIKDLKVEFIFLTDNSFKETVLDYFISFRKYNQYIKAVYLGNNPFDANSVTLKKKLRVLEEKSINVFM